MTEPLATIPGAPTLRRIAGGSWGRGYATLLSKELASWTRTRLGWVQLALWTLLLGGLLAVPLVFMRDLFATEFGGPLTAALDMFFNLAALAPSAGIVILAHGTIIGERQLGTAAWVLSKPVARSAFVLAKFTAFGIGSLVTALTLPAVVAYSALSFEAGAPLDALRFAAGVGMVSLGLLWYLALTLMLGTLASSRGLVLALPLAAVVGGDLLVGLWSTAAELGPWMLGRMALLVAQGGPLLSAWPLVTTLGGILAFLTVALWRFEREEF